LKSRRWGTVRYGNKKANPHQSENSLYLQINYFLLESVEVSVSFTFTGFFGVAFGLLLTLLLRPGVLTPVDFELRVAGAVPAFCPEDGFEAGLLVTVGADRRAVPAFCSVADLVAGLFVTLAGVRLVVLVFGCVDDLVAGLFVTLAGVLLVVLVFGCVDDLVAGLFVTAAGARLVGFVFCSADDLVAGLFVTAAGACLVVLVFCSADDLVAGLFVTGAGARLVITAPEVDWEPDLLSILFPEGLSAGWLFCSLYILVYKTSPSLLCSGCEYVLL
jgi:hypothetical protein